MMSSKDEGRGGMSPRLVAPEAATVPQSAPRLRAFLVGLPLLVGICFISVLADMVSKDIQFGVLQIAPPAVVALFALTLLNRGLARLTRRTFLSRADLLVIYMMSLVGVMISTRGAVEKIIPPLAYLPYYATDANALNTLITRHLPAWAMPFTPSAALKLPETIKQYYEGVRPGDTPDVSVWIGPLLIWFVLLLCVFCLFICLGTLLRRRWVEQERLAFPLTRLPLALLNDTIEHQPLLRNRLFWLGFVVPVVLFGMNGIAANIPAVPTIPLDYDLTANWTERPWNGTEGIRLWTSLAAIGFAYFLPNDLLFSLWFFFLMTRAQDVVLVAFGGEPQGIGTHNARVFTGYQAAGAYLILIAVQLRLSWPSLKQAYQTAFAPRAHPPNLPDDQDELVTYRTAFIGLVASFAAIILWLTLAGMSPLLAAAQMGIYLFVIAIIMTRSVSEAGILITETSFLPSHLIRLIQPLPLLGAQNLSLLALTDIVFTRDMRGVLLSPLMDGQKMAGEIGMRLRSLLWPLLLAFTLSFAVGSGCFLYFHYTLGGVNLYSYPNNNAGNMYGQSAAVINGSYRPPDISAYGGLAVGLVVGTLLTVLRTRLPWFPLHPLGYAIAPTWTMYVFAFPVFVAWGLKSLIARYGGIVLYRRFAPLMIGLILGEFTMAFFWAILSTPAIGWNAPLFPWP